MMENQKKNHQLYYRPPLYKICVPLYRTTITKGNGTKPFPQALHQSVKHLNIFVNFLSFFWEIAVLAHILQFLF